MKIYTKTGDQGETGYIGGRISKASDMIEVVGDLDELNATIGLVVSGMDPDRFSDLSDEMKKVQAHIFSIGACVANPGQKEEDARLLQNDLSSATKRFEDHMDELDSKLPPLQNFILPGGSNLGAQIHHARTVCRKAERSLVRMQVDIRLAPGLGPTRKETLASTSIYLNRLSDWLFVLARYVNQELGTNEEIWSSNAQAKLKL